MSGELEVCPVPVEAEALGAETKPTDRARGKVPNSPELGMAARKKPKRRLTDPHNIDQERLPDKI